MDLGFFQSSRLRFWLWLAIPVGLGIAVTASSLAWLHQERRGLDERQALMADLPLVEMQVGKMEAVLKSTTPAADQQALAADLVSRRMDQAAKKADLTVRSVKFDETGEAVEGFVVLRIAVQIQGSLRSVVQWLDEIQKPGILLNVKQANLEALGLPPNDMYSGDVVLAVYLRSL